MLDIKAGGFWARGVTAFFHVRVTHVNSKCYQSKPTSEVFKVQEEEKKRKYQQRVLDVEMGSFTPLVFALFADSRINEGATLTIKSSFMVFSPPCMQQM